MFGILDFEEEAAPEDVLFTYNISFPVSNTEYSGVTVELDVVKLSQAFLLQPGEIRNKMDGDILFYAVESDGNLNGATTANGYGHWFDANGNVVSWGEEAIMFSEFDLDAFSFSVGQYPERSKSGDTFTLKQAFVYEPKPGQKVQATVVFNVTIE